MEIGIIAVVIALLIVVKTGSLGKAIGFLFKWAVLPVVCSIVGMFLLGLKGLVIGLVIGIVLVFKDAGKKVGGN